MNTLEQLNNIISDVLGQKVELTMNTDLMTDLSLNSLDIMEMIVQVEDTFDVSISDRTIRSIKTAADVIRLIEQQKS